MELTQKQKQELIAKHLGTDNRWTLVKRGLYYRPDAHGYTNSIHEAWILSEEEADKYVYPHDEPVTKHRAPLPDYFGDLNAAHEMEKAIPDDQRQEYFIELVDFGNAPAGWDCTHATADRKAESFGRTMKLWGAE